MNRLSSKLIEVLSVVVPFVVLISVFHITIVPLGHVLYSAFLISSAFVITGLTLFLVGVDLGITPLGMRLGPLLARSKSILVLIIFAFIIGFFISFAEPALLVMSVQVSELSFGLIPAQLLNIVVSVGIGLLVALGFIRIFYSLPLYRILWILYVLIFIFSLFASPQLLAIAFDASGVTTGVLAVPFLLSLSLGVTLKQKDSKASEKDSFGMISIASAGAIIAVLLLGMISRPVFTAMPNFPVLPSIDSLMQKFQMISQTQTQEALISIAPLIILYLFVLWLYKIRHSEQRQIWLGFIYASLGLVLFLIGVNGSFIEVGRHLGSTLMDNYDGVTLMMIGFVFGVVTIIAEPAVSVLTKQIESVTSGYISRVTVTIALALGVGIAISLSVLRILVPSLQLWHFLLPGYVIALSLTFVVPKLFIGIAFDAGGVATGPMVSSILMAFIHGIAHAHPSADILIDGFGMVAMVAMLPILSLLILGWIYKLKLKGAKS